MSYEPNDPARGDRGVAPDPGREPETLPLPRLILNWLITAVGLGGIVLLGSLL